MRMRLLIFLCLLFLGCSQATTDDYKQSNVELKNINIKEIDKIRIENADSTVIAQLLPRFAINSDATRMAFYDLLYKHFVITDENGKILHIIGGQGRGPDEFIQALNFNFDEHNNLVVFDEAQKQMKIFGPEGSIEQTFNILGDSKFAIASSELFAKDSLIYMGVADIELFNTKNAWKSKMLAIFDFNGNIQGIYGTYDPYVTEATYYGSNPIFYVNTDESKLYSTHRNSYRIQIYSFMRDTLTSYFGYRSTHFKESAEIIASNFPRAKIFKMSLNQSFPEGIFVTSKYVIQYFQNLTEKWFQTKDYQTQDHFFVIYDRETHNFNTELELPSIVGTVHNDLIYLIENSNPDNYIIGVYELQTN